MLTIKTEPTIEDFAAFNVELPSGAMLWNVRKRRKPKVEKFTKITLNGIEFDARRPPAGRLEKLAAKYRNRIGFGISPFDDENVMAELDR